MLQFALLLILLACAVSMMFRMRGGHGHTMVADSPGPIGRAAADTTEQTMRIAQLEREVARLQQHNDGPGDAPLPRDVGDGSAAAITAAGEPLPHVH